MVLMLRKLLFFKRKYARARDSVWFCRRSKTKRDFFCFLARSLSFSLSVFLFTSSSSSLHGGLDSSIQEQHDEYIRALLLKRRVTPPLPTKKDTLFFSASRKTTDLFL